MSREILFKAKCFDDGKWVEGCYIRDVDRDKSGSLSKFAHKIQPLYSQAYAEPVLPETICQYTGLTDKNGKKIWENDIVETVYDGKQNPNYVVIWDEDELDFKATNGEEHYKTNYEYLGCCDEIVVIGNIFDNPELLGAGTE